MSVWATRLGGCSSFVIAPRQRPCRSVVSTMPCVFDYKKSPLLNTAFALSYATKRSRKISFVWTVRTRVRELVTLVILRSS